MSQENPTLLSRSDVPPAPKNEKAYVVGLLLCILAIGAFILPRLLAVQPNEIPAAIRTPVAPEIQYSPLRTGIFDAGRVFGRAGCGDYALAEKVARYAAREGVPARVLAAVIAVESHCNPLAVSNKGALGLTQVRVSTWRAEYDFARVNLLDPDTSVRVGAEILGREIRAHGLRDGVRRYNGSGPDAEAYTERVLALAGN